MSTDDYDMSDWWFYMVDVVISCPCGDHIQFTDEGVSTRRCKTCGQEWGLTVTAEKINDDN